MVFDTTYYNLLGVREDATALDIKKGYRKQAVIHHPDKNLDDPSAPLRFQKVSTHSITSKRAHVSEILNRPTAKFLRLAKHIKVCKGRDECVARMNSHPPPWSGSDNP